MILYLILFLSVTADAWRDAWLNRGWWERHLPKWIGFYIPLLYILYLHGYFVYEKLPELIVLAVFGLVWWSIVYKTMGNV